MQTFGQQDESITDHIECRRGGGGDWIHRKRCAAVLAQAERNYERADVRSQDALPLDSPRGVDPVGPLHSVADCTLADGDRAETDRTAGWRDIIWNRGFR